MTWDMGNGDTVQCDNPGVIWRKSLADRVSTCDYTYTQRSINPPDHTWELAGTVTFDIDYTTNAPGIYGPFTPIQRISTQTIQVLEIQAVNR